MKKSKSKIFIVEDDLFYAELVRNTLVNDGYENLTLFDNGPECINSLGKDEMPDVVILDHMLGQMSGIHVLKKIKAFNPKIQVIFLSGQEDIKVAVNALKFGALDYIEKNHKQAMVRLMVILERGVSLKEKMSKNLRVEALKKWFLLQ